jgi:hypothetical protein
MRGHPTHRIWWKPRFSLRAVLILVTLACVYLAAWRATATKGLKNTQSYVNSRYNGEGPPVEATKIPFILAATYDRTVIVDNTIRHTRHRTYYHWLAGSVGEIATTETTVKQLILAPKAAKLQKH